MARNIFWFILLFSIVVCGTCISAEANISPISGGISQIGNSGGGQPGSSGNGGSSGGQSRAGASGRSGHRIPKPKEDHGWKRKGNANKGYPKRKRKKKKRGSRKKLYEKLRNRQMKALSPTDEKQNSMATKRKGARDNEIAGKGSEESGVLEDLKIRSERADDIPLLLGIMQQMGLDKVIDKHVPKHWKQRDLSWGKTCIIWLAYILSEGDHRKVSVREYIRNMHISLSEIMGCKINEHDFTDDRCGIVLKYFWF